MRRTLILFVLLLTLCGCNNKNEDKYADFEHYNLDGENIISHSYTDDNGFQQKYAVADITPDSYEISVYGLFYQTSTNDFILLDKIESAQKKEDVSRFNDNKLYVVGQGLTTENIEYTLNQEKITKKELEFDFYKGFLTRSIEDIKDNNIYYSALTNDDSDNHSINVKLKCSLDTYKCELDEE